METAFSGPGGSARSGGGEDAGALSLHQRIALGGRGDDQRIAIFEPLQTRLRYRPSDARFTSPIGQSSACQV